MRSLALWFVVALPVLAQAQPPREAPMCQPAAAASSAKAKGSVVLDGAAPRRPRALPGVEPARRPAPAAGGQKEAGPEPARAPIGLCDGS